MPELPADIRDERVRRIVVAAAKGGGGLLGVGTAIAGASVGVLAVQARRAKRTIGPRRSVAPYVDGRFNTGARGTSLRISILGDSGAAGLGAAAPEETPGGLIAAAIAAASDRPVVLSSSAVVGSRSRDLDSQVTRTMTTRPHLAVIMIGANDVTHLDRPQVSVRLLANAVTRLRADGTQVVVGTCPDLGTVRPIPQPLRAYAHRASCELAAAQAVAVEAAGGHAVGLADLLGAAFADEPEAFFSSDGFHPSAMGYAACAAALLPDCLDALGLAPHALAVWQL